jgi:hypothetical protein
MAEELSKRDASYNIESLKDDEVRLLSLNIFPQGKTVLHYIYKRIPELQYLYHIARTSDSPIVPPFIQNF